MPNVYLDYRVPQQLVSGLNAPGYTNSQLFSVATGCIGSVLLQAGYNGSVSVALFNFEVSLVPGKWSIQGVWDAVNSPLTTFSVSMGGLSRLNCTSFTGAGTVDVWGAVTQTQSSNIVSGGGGGGGGGSVTQGTIPWITSGQTSITENGNTAVVSNTGALKVDGSSVTQPVESDTEGILGQPIPNKAMLMGAEDPNGNLAPLQVDLNGKLLIQDLDSGVFP